MTPKKIFGYIVSLAGLAGVLAYAIPEVRARVPLPEQMSETILLGVSIVLVLVGLFLVTRSGGRGRKQGEVPIYQGKEIVGYRRG